MHNNIVCRFGPNVPARPQLEQCACKITLQIAKILDSESDSVLLDEANNKREKQKHLYELNI
jgi:hypothetical protein